MHRPVGAHFLKRFNIQTPVGVKISDIHLAEARC
jgi:hypothetical protein